jgi:hypothetical protein
MIIEAAAPTVVEARGRVLMESGWMTEMSEMVVQRGSAMRILPRAPRRSGEPSAAMPASLAWPGAAEGWLEG